jgi:hypothetical protein
LPEYRANQPIISIGCISAHLAILQMLRKPYPLEKNRFGYIPNTKAFRHLTSPGKYVVKTGKRSLQVQVATEQHVQPSPRPNAKRQEIIFPPWSNHPHLLPQVSWQESQNEPAQPPVARKLHSPRARRNLHIRLLISNAACSIKLFSNLAHVRGVLCGLSTQGRST